MRMDTHPSTPHLQTLGEPVGLDTPYEETMAATVANSLAASGPRHRGHGYTSSQPLLAMENILVLTIHHDRRTCPFNGVVPAPYQWAPKIIPKQWVYTDGSDITGHPRLGASLVHIPSTSTICIDDAGT